ncbi:FG-GAP repeat protein, partial [bacterium]|nr:FG-GAP repeat protein [bacterium]
MTNITTTYFEYNYTDYTNGTYSYRIFANDTSGNSVNSSTATFQMYVNMSIQVRTLNDSYSDNEIVNLTDPPGFEQLSSFLNSLITKTTAGEKPPTNNTSTIPIQPRAATNNITANIPREITPALTAAKNHFSLNENPEFEFLYMTEEEFAESGRKSAMSTHSKPEKASTSTFVYHNGKLTGIKPEIEKLRDGKFSIKLPKKRSLQAGIYSLKVNLAKDNKTYTREQEFTWGVLAVNTHKSIYLEDETAFIGIAVLDDNGKMVCDAPMTLEITDPLNNREILSTQNGKIEISPECSVYGVTNLPDYYANYTVNSAGTYVMNLTAVTSNGIRTIQDTFTVQRSVDFDVARDGPTRIYPPVPYTMNFTIKANRDYDGLIREYVPASFEITPQDGLTVERKGDTRVLIWDRKLNKGETYSIYYEFDAPDISPYLFVLGGFGIGSFREERTWKIASDAEEEKWFENCADLGDWVLEPPTGWSAGTECDSSGTEDNMTRGPTDMSDAYSANLSFWWKATKIDADEYFRVWVSDDNSIWVKMFEWVGNGSDIQGGLTDEYDLKDNISLTSTVYIRFECKSGGGEHCYVDNINLSYIPDNPLNWSNPQENATTVYRNDKVRFNTTWEDDHGLSGYIFSINQDGSWVNSSFTGFGGTWNISENITEITAAGGTTIYWRFYANDSGGNWNQTDVQSFAVANSVVVENLTVTPQKVLNNTNVSISVDTASIKGTVDTVKAIVYYPNGTWMKNVSLTGSGTYTGNTSKINFYPHGTYSVTIRANDSTGDMNDSVKTWFIPYLVLSDSQNITINGSFDDWAGVKNVSDVVSDGLVPAKCYLSSTSDVDLTDHTAEIIFGSEIAVGDVNNDSISDVVVGASIASKSFVYYGNSSGLSSTSDVDLTDHIAEDSFGYKIAVGDVNNDSISDIVVGAYGAKKAFVYYGSSSGLSSTSDVNLTDHTAEDSFGSEIAVGDVNNDNISDVVVGAYNNRKAFVYYGSSSGLSSTSDVDLTDHLAESFFGYKIAVGDVNNDSISDIVVGAYGANKAFVYYGS